MISLKFGLTVDLRTVLCEKGRFKMASRYVLEVQTNIEVGFIHLYWSLEQEVKHLLKVFISWICSRWQGLKMSKSLGNVISPDEILKTMGQIF